LQILFILLLCLLLVFLLLPHVSVGFGPAKKASAKNAVFQLVVASALYTEQYGSPPTGNLSEILKTLGGSNPRKIVFAELNLDDLSKDGKLLDPWGSPYIYDLSDSSPWAYSIGKNRV